MPTSLKEMLAAANAEVPRVPPAEAKALIERGNTLVVDVRDAGRTAERRQDQGRGASCRAACSNSAPTRKARITTPPLRQDKTVLVYCASGGRSALSGKTLKDLGYASVFNIGGFKELADAGLDTEPG